MTDGKDGGDDQLEAIALTVSDADLSVKHGVVLDRHRVAARLILHMLGNAETPYAGSRASGPPVKEKSDARDS